MEALKGKNVILQDGELLAREKRNEDYLMELDSGALLQNYTLEAGRYQEFGSKKLKHGGWEDPSCQLRGHFLGHWLSAAAMRYAEDGNEELIGKAGRIVHELRLCQIDNGGRWAASIPEKYFKWIAAGKAVWAPHYTVHKTFMGLLDMYRYAGNEEALQVAVDFSKWFLAFTEGFDRGQMDDILDFETGGMLEVWADLYEFTKDESYLTLMERYDRRRLFEPLLEGVDLLTNMHANTTIPEIIGCARIYEETGKERYRNIVTAYWDMAVTQRGEFVTGGQTCGEVWTPKHSMAVRLGDKNQEHCTVYNMIRLADILFTWTKDPSYLDYIEKNIYNGIMAQAYWRENLANGQKSEYPPEGLLTYFLPFRAGERKGWASKTQDFFCCHGTVVQANAAHNRYLYYQDGRQVYVAQYFDSTAVFTVDGQEIVLEQKRDSLSGSFHFSSTSSAGQCFHENTRKYPNHPDCMAIGFRVQTGQETEFDLCLRIPAWVKGEVLIEINGERASVPTAPGNFAVIGRRWKEGDEIRLILPLAISCTPLEGEEGTVAFSYGPIALAGLCGEERSLDTHGREPQELLVHENEREWGSWKCSFKTRYQDPGIRFLPLYQIGYERYQVYFPLI